ncbi:MAG: glycosyltransferase family 2 protein [Lachnospiraceae bacterium]|nr:glycosyltransferase family 2 protein [Lachnospiraceae bacterium]
MEQKFLTVLTPTYNRAEKLKDLYECLKRQTCKNFEWFIVDDGSKDHTKELVVSFIEEDTIDIKYIYKENGGKHTALNYVASMLESELTMIVDSDDLLLADAVETIFNDWIENCERPGIGGMVYLRGYSVLEHIGDKWPYDEQYGNTITHTCNKSIKGDKAEVFLTKFLERYPFPEYEGEKFFSESYLWIEIAKKYNMMLFNKIIYLTTYLDDGLTKSGRRMQIESPLGAMKNAESYMYPKFSFKIRFKNAILYNCYGRFAGKTYKEIIKRAKYKFLVRLGAIPGAILYKKWKK